MKTLSLLLIAFLLCSGAKINNSLREARLKGKVKSITQYVSVSLSGKEEISNKSTYSYDDRGNDVADSTYKPDGSLIYASKRDYVYNEKGCKTEENIYNKDGSLSWKTIFNYDTNGALTEARRYHNTGQLEEKYIYKYDAKSNNIEEISYNAKDSINSISTLKYDEQDNLIEEMIDCSNIAWLVGDMSVKICTKYDINASQSEHIEYNRENKVIVDSKRSELFFDNRGNWIRMTVITQQRGRQDTITYKREITYY